MKKNIFIAICMLLTAYLSAQITGEVNYKELGIRFTIPSGWAGQEAEGGFFIASTTEPGFVFIIQHDYTSLEAIKKDADAGLEDSGVSLKRSSEFEPFGKNGIGAAFSGTMNGQSAKAYLLSLLNPYGTGVTVMAATESAKYSDKYKQLALTIAKSVQFSKVETPPIVQEWKQELMNKRLSYLYSSSSNTNGYTGISEKEEMWLCAAGYFQYKSNSHDTFDTSGAYGYSNNNQKGGGTWDVVPDGAGNAILKLSFQDGTVKTYKIDGVKDGKFYMSGYRYFKTDGGDVCN